MTKKKVKQVDRHAEGQVSTILTTGLYQKGCSLKHYDGCTILFDIHGEVIKSWDRIPSLTDLMDTEKELDTVGCLR